MSLTIGITGANGYVGSRLRTALAAAGHEIVPLVRNPAPGEREFVLGSAVLRETLEDLDVLIHCAWDMQSSNAATVERVNVRGSKLLLETAHAAGVARLIFISSMSAYEDCRSVYGRAKLSVENYLARLGGVSIRPGLIYGPKPGGVVGRMLSLARRSTWLPMVGDGHFLLHSCHEDDLAELVLITCMCAANRLHPVVTAAEEQARPFAEVVRYLAGRPLRFITIPWRLIWAVLRVLEAAGLKTGLKSDSVTGLVYSDPAPNFATLRSIGATFRPLERSVTE